MLRGQWSITVLLKDIILKLTLLVWSFKLSLIQDIALCKILHIFHIICPYIVQSFYHDFTISENSAHSFFVLIRYFWHLKLYFFNLCLIWSLICWCTVSAQGPLMSVDDVSIRQSAARLAELIAALQAASVMQSQRGLSNELSGALIHHQWQLAAPPLIRHDTQL